MLSPTYQLLHDVFLAAWEDIVPDNLYTINRSKMIINMINGSRIYLRSRHIDNPRRGKEAHRGLDVNWVIDDEAALGFDLELYTNVSACIRRKGAIRFYACCTTPRLNEYYNLATRQGHRVVYSSSRDNPHLPEGWVDELQEQMSAQQSKREIDGQWVALEGLVWSEWSNDLWPHGNIHEHEYTPDYPWHLWLDLGVGNGAYLVIQRIPAEHGNIRLFDGFINVVVAECTPMHDGSAARALQRLGGIYGQPASIVAGADINTRSNSDGSTPMYFANQIFPGTPVYPISGWVADKQVQYNRATYLINSVHENRRLCISKGLKSLDPDAHRGMRELMQQDTWPENAGKVRGQFLAKEGRLEHVRDALLYGCVHASPPTFAVDRQAA